MPRPCTVCVHPERAAIDRDLLAGRACRDIAGRHGLGKSAVARHGADHLPASLARAADARAVADADALLREAEALRAKAMALLRAAELAGDLRTALAGVREARGCLELLARLSGELRDGATVNVVVTPGWAAVRAVVVAALAHFPEARAAVAERLLALEAGAAADGGAAAVGEGG